MTPQQFRPRAVDVAAIQFTGEASCEEVFAFLGLEHRADEGYHGELFVPTANGLDEASPGDWIVKYSNGVYEVWADTAFVATYEPVDGAA